MIQKIIITLALSSVAVVSYADVLVNQSNKASPATVLAKTFEQALNDKSIDFFQATTCEEAQAKFQSGKNSVMMYNSDVGIAALNKKLACPLTATAEQTIFIGRSYTEICSSNARPRTIDNAKTLGMASVLLSQPLIDDYNSNGLQLKGVPYGGSKDVLGALLAGDIDLGVLGTGIAEAAVKEGKISCLLSTDPQSANFVGKKFKLKIPALPIIQIFYTNSKDIDFINRLRKGINDGEFQKFLKQHGYSDVKFNNITNKDVSDVQQHIANRYNFYWK